MSFLEELKDAIYVHQTEYSNFTRYGNNYQHLNFSQFFKFAKKHNISLKPVIPRDCQHYYYTFNFTKPIASK